MAAQAQEPAVSSEPKDTARVQAGDALTAARFSITIDGHEIASFSELQGINTLATPPTIVLKRGKSSSREMWSWHEAARTGQMSAGRKNASLIMYDYEGKPVARYQLTNAWPSKIEIGSLKAGASEVLMETVTMVCDHIQRVSK
jgi:hypothetical protein